MKFIELNQRDYYRGDYISTKLLVAIDDISKVVECMDDYSCTNVVTKDGKVHTLNEKYSDVIRKIQNAYDE